MQQMRIVKTDGTHDSEKKKNRSFSFLLLSTVGLLGGLLLLVLVGLVAGRAGQRTLQDLQDLLVFDLLVRLELRKVGGLGSGQTLDTVLGDGCMVWLVAVRVVVGVSIWIQKTYQEWSTDERREHCQRHQQAHTVSARRYAHTRRHRPWRPSHRRAGAN